MNPFQGLQMLTTSFLFIDLKISIYLWQQLINLIGKIAHIFERRQLNWKT